MDDRSETQQSSSHKRIVAYAPRAYSLGGAGPSAIIEKCESGKGWM